jgi:hypothetical protein
MKNCRHSISSLEWVLLHRTHTKNALLERTPKTYNQKRKRTLSTNNQNALLKMHLQNAHTESIHTRWTQNALSERTLRTLKTQTLNRTHTQKRTPKHTLSTTSIENWTQCKNGPWHLTLWQIRFFAEFFIFPDSLLLFLPSLVPTSKLRAIHRGFRADCEASRITNYIREIQLFSFSLSLSLSLSFLSMKSTQHRVWLELFLLLFLLLFFSLLLSLSLSFLSF